jgi:hypothetical protein
LEGLSTRQDHCLTKTDDEPQNYDAVWAKRLECTLALEPLCRAFETIIEHHLALVAQDADHAQLPRQALEVVQALKLELNLWRAQNLFWRYLTGGPQPADPPLMLELGRRLGFNLAAVSKLLHANVSSIKPADSSQLQAE